MSTVPNNLLPWMRCTKCAIGRFAHKHVFGRGELPCDLFFIGEGPGRSEDVIGEAFVGPAGRLLDKALKDVPGRKFFGNLLMCRPCDGLKQPNRAPLEEEVRNCSPRLRETLSMSGAKAVILLGRVPALYWGIEFGDQTLPVLRMSHPAALLRRGGENCEQWNAYVRTFARFAKEVLTCLKK